jgi:hypothetical protein
MEIDDAVMDLTVACVTSVKNATGLELDLSQDTLPILDHYARLAESSREEVLSLIAPMCGAYFGELVRRELGDGTWEISGSEHASWRLHFERCELSFNPLGIAAEVLLGMDAPEWGGHLQVKPDDEARVKAALEVLGEVRDSDFYTFSVRYEAIEQVARTLSNDPEGMAPKG